MTPFRYIGFVLFGLMLMAAFWGCSKGSDYRVGIEVVEPLDDPPLERAASLDVLVVNTLDPEDQAFFRTEAEQEGFDTLSLRLDGIGYYPQFVALATAYDAEGAIIATGRTVDVVTRAYDGQNVGLYLAPPAAATRPPVELTRARAGLVIASPNDADVLFIGGAQGGPEGLRDTVAPVGYFSPALYTLTPLSVDGSSVRFGDGVIGHQAATLTGSAVLVAGGYSRRGDVVRWLEEPVLIASDLTDVVVPVELAAAFAPRHKLALAPALALGEVWICGGEDPDGALLRDCARVDADTRTLRAAGALDTPRAGHTMTALVDDGGTFLGVLVYGGNAPDTSAAAFWGADDKGPGALDGLAPDTRRDHAAGLIGPGRVLVTGGYVDAAVSANVRSLRIGCEDCPILRDHGDLLEQPRAGHSLTVMSDTLAVACGGVGQEGEALDSCEFLQRDGNKMIHAGTIRLSAPRRDHAAVLLPDGTVMIAGGYNTGDGALATVEIITAPLP